MKLVRILGPMPCKGCRALVILAKRDGIRALRDASTGILHDCDGLPASWTWRDLVARYGEDEALVQLSGLRKGDYRTERAKAYNRRYQRQRRAAAREAAA